MRRGPRPRATTIGPDVTDQPALLPTTALAAGSSTEPSNAPATDADTVVAHHAKGQRRPPDTIWRANPREQGLVGLTDAIAWFGARGWSVALPLIDSQPYDLVVDDAQRLHRVQVKTTTTRSDYGVYKVSLCTNGGNQSFHTTKLFEATSCDLLYILTDAQERYVIPTSVVTARRSLNLGGKVQRYRVDSS